MPGANLGQTVAVFEAVHGSAPDIAGQDKANPTALLLSAVMMLRHIGERTAADAIIGAPEHACWPAGDDATRDLGGTASTTEYTDAVVREIRRAARYRLAPLGGRLLHVILRDRRRHRARRCWRATTSAQYQPR